MSLFVGKACISVLRSSSITNCARRAGAASLSIPAFRRSTVLSISPSPPGAALPDLASSASFRFVTLVTSPRFWEKKLLYLRLGIAASRCLAGGLSFPLFSCTHAVTSSREDSVRL